MSPNLWEWGKRPHVLYCHHGGTTICRGCSHVANPVWATASPTSGQPARLVRFQDYLLTNHTWLRGHAKAIHQADKRCLCAGPYEDQITSMAATFSALLCMYHL